jgi:PPOX class probable F420-dependent enzyme
MTTSHTSKPVPADYLDLFSKPAFAHLATLMPDGSPQVTPVWIDYDGTYLIVNAAQGRQKNRNMAKRSRVAIDVIDPDYPYRYLAVRGYVREITTALSRYAVSRTLAA